MATGARQYKMTRDKLERDRMGMKERLAEVQSENRLNKEEVGLTFIKLIN